MSWRASAAAIDDDDEGRVAGLPATGFEQGMRSLERVHGADCLSRVGRRCDLVEIASTKGQDHLLAISGRENLPEAVTDVIVDRGESRVIRKLANNASARFSEAGYSNVTRSETDAELIEILGLRIDLPLKFLRDLLSRATQAVRERLLALASPELQEEIKRVLKDISA